MYRILSCSKDAYIQNKYIANSRSIEANTGHAGTLDLYKLFDETHVAGISSSIIELSRVLLQFDYSDILDINVSHPTFTASIVLKDVYGGQTTPSNFSLIAYPLSKSWDEGTGFDVVSYRDLDACNFVSASENVTWSQEGCEHSGNLGDIGIDYVVSGNFGAGLESLSSISHFSRGDEDGVFNITKVVSASIAGLIANNGFRISFLQAAEQDSITRFVKRFASKHSLTNALHPKLVIEIDDKIIDHSGEPKFGISQSFYSYNFVNGQPSSFVSGGNSLTSLTFEFFASKSIQFMTSSFQPNFSASINHLTRSVVFYSKSFATTQVETGVYKTDIILDSTSDSELYSFLDGNESWDFLGLLTDNTKTTTYEKDFYLFTSLIGGGSNSEEKNYVVNATNLKNTYKKQEKARIRVFVQDRNSTLHAHRHAQKTKSTIIEDMRWRLVKPYSAEVLIPFSDFTRMSTDRDGMYFDLFMTDLNENEVYELEFMIKQNNKDFVVSNKGFIFRVEK